MRNSSYENISLHPIVFRAKHSNWHPWDMLPPSVNLFIAKGGRLGTISCGFLFGGWTNPSEKYVRQFGSWNPKGSGWKFQKQNELPPTRFHAGKSTNFHYHTMGFLGIFTDPWTAGWFFWRGFHGSVNIPTSSHGNPSWDSGDVSPRYPGLPTLKWWRISGNAWIRQRLG